VRRDTCSSDADCRAGACKDGRKGDGKMCRYGGNGSAAVAGRPLLPPGWEETDPFDVMSVDMACEPIGCNACFENRSCVTDDDCPVHHRCMRQEDGSTGPTSDPAAPGEEMPFATPMCLLRPWFHAVSPTDPIAAPALATVTSALSRLAVPEVMKDDEKDVVIDRIEARIDDITVSTTGESIRLEIDLSDLRAEGEHDGDGFTVTGVDPHLNLYLTPYVFDEHVAVSVTDAVLDGDITVSGGGFWAVFLSLVLPGFSDILERQATGAIENVTLGGRIGLLAGDLGHTVQELLDPTTLRALIAYPSADGRVPILPGERVDQVTVDGWSGLHVLLRDTR
jgi:hypothetical protein